MRITPDYTLENDVERILAQLTLQEKIALCTGNDSWHTVPIKRLGVPSIRLSDGPNGVRGTKFFNSVPTACIPGGTGLASSWDKTLMSTIGYMMGEQARAKGAHVLLGPNINMPRSPLGGRGFESLGEDPILSGLLASAYCRGVKDAKVAICPKHLVCNDKEDQRMTLDAVVSERALREVYLMPFMLLQKFVQPEMYMTSYSKINGKHGSENKTLLTDVVRNEWGFDGAFVSDWFGVVSCADSINSGLDLEMPGPSIWRAKLLEMSLFHNTVTETVLDSAVRNVLKLVLRTTAISGIPENAHEGERDDEETRKILRKAAQDSIVLLKNENSVLPLDKSKKVLLVGEAAKVATYASGGCASVVPYYSVSLYDALVDRDGGHEMVEYTLGAPNSRSFPSIGRYAIDHPQDSNTIRFSVYDDPRTVRDRKPISVDYVPEIDAILGDYDPKKLRNPEQLYAEFKATIRVPKTGYYRFNLQVSGLARIFVDDTLRAVNDLEHKTSGAFGLDAPEVFKDIHLTAGTDHEVEIDFESTLGKSSFITGYGTVKCGMREGYDIDAKINEAAQLASQFEQVIVITGLNKDFECEGFDRKTMDLPEFQDDLIDAVVAANPNTVVVIESGTPVTMPWIQRVSTLVHSSFGGSEVGRGLADVLYGDVNPSGKLPVTFPKRLQDNPAYANFSVDGGQVVYGEGIYAGYRHYDKLDIEPLFPFGFGLSYTAFTLSNLKVGEPSNGLVDLSVQVTNVGSVGGAEVVQVYVSFQSSLVSRAVKELKDFAKVYLNPEQSKTVNLTLDMKYATSFFNELIGKWQSEVGRYNVLVGTSSRGTHLTGSFNNKRALQWVGI